MAVRADEVDPGGQLERFDEALVASGCAQGDLLVPNGGTHRSNGRRASLTLGEAARIIHEAVKDKSYRKTPLGQLVGRYLRWFRNEYGRTESTIRDYEAILARMSLPLDDREPLEVSTEDIREVIDTWAMKQAHTRAKVTSVVRAFWVWAEEESHVAFSPAAKIRRPRAPRKTAPLLAAHVDELLLGCAQTARDRLALLVLLDWRPARRARQHQHTRLRPRSTATHGLRQGSDGTRHFPSRAYRHGAACVPRRAPRVDRAPARARRLPPVPREAHAGPARLLG